jgi:hypothetical protein
MKWNGMEWNHGMESWNGIMEWNHGMEWNGIEIMDRSSR